MLTDEDLNRLLETAASAAPPPEGLDMSTFAVDVDPRRVRSYRPAIKVLGIAAAACVALLLGTAVFTSTFDKPATTFGTVANSIGGGAPAVPGTPAPTGAAAAGAGPGGAPPETTSPAPPAVPKGDTAKVIKNGTLEIGVGKGTVTESVNRLTTLAAGLGGYVSDSRTTSNAASGSQASATMAVRVPAAAFEQLMTEAAKLGEVHSTSTSGQDVTAQFTDIDAQLQALNATRDQLLLVLGQASNVGDILAVQDRITQVQTQMDQLEGQKRLLTDQTSFGTLSVTLLEPGATVAAPPPVDHGSDLGDAWHEAREHFVDGIESIVAASGSLALVVLCGGSVLLVSWLVYRRLRLRTL